MFFAGKNKKKDNENLHIRNVIIYETKGGFTMENMKEEGYEIDFWAAQRRLEAELKAKKEAEKENKKE